MSPRLPSLALGSVLILARRLSVSVVATINRKYQPNSKSTGLGAFPAAQHFPFAASGRGTLRDKPPRSAPYLQRWAS